MQYRLPRPDEMGTAIAVRTSNCPTCGTSYITLTRPMFITTDLGEILMIYREGQLICYPCLKYNLGMVHAEAHLS